MLDVVFYHTTQDLAAVELDSVKPLVVCPSPLVADGLRKLMPSGLEIITISKWVSDFLKSKNQKKSNKAELMLRLSSVWRHYFPEEEAEIFFRSFELFTELRSFTLNLDLLSDFLKELDDKIAKSVLIFWAFLENEKIIDEHKSYQLCAEMKLAKPLWLIGFKHLSGIQIDMLKEIGESTEVGVFFPKDVYDETLSSDWIRWIVPEAVTVPDSQNKKIDVVYFPKNKLNIVLKTLHEKRSKFDITLASQQIDFHHRQEVALPGQFFKSPQDLFQSRREKYFESLSDALRFKSISLTELLNQITDGKREVLKQQDFISYKILILMEEALSLYGEFQQSLDLFSVKVLKQIIELNSPRVSLATIVTEFNSGIFDINELPYRDTVNPLVVIASSSYGSLKSSDSKYSEKMIETLRPIAPLKRAGLEFLYRKHEIRQSLAQPNSLLLMEEGLEQVDLAWREILKDFSIQIVNSESQYNLKIKKDYLAARMTPGPYTAKHFSASRLQAYLDCPRRYYFSFIEKLDHRPDERMKLGADEMGTLEHAIISKYFGDYGFLNELNQKGLEAICEKTLLEFLSKNKIGLSEKLRLTTFFELMHFSQNGIEFLLSFCKSEGATSIEFEKELQSNEWSLSGSIDCIVSLPEGKIAVFDFKRSQTAIGSKKETLAFDKLQIWTYLLYMIRHEKKSIHTWGYLNLSETDESQLYNEIISPVINDQIIDEFASLIEKTKGSLIEEVHFAPKPRLPKVCKFCEVQLFCQKEVCS